MRATREEQIATALTKLGYIDRGIPSGRLFIRLREGDIRTHNLHLSDPDNTDRRDQIAFRNAIRKNPKLRDQFAGLEQMLLEERGDQRRGMYAGRKTEFVRGAIETPNE